MTDEEAEAQRGKAFPRPHSKSTLNAAFLPRGMLPTKIYLGMDGLSFVEIKSAVPTAGGPWNSIWAFASALFSHGLQRRGIEDWVEVTWGQQAGTEIANEEIAFGNSVETSGTFTLREKEAEDEAQETRGHMLSAAPCTQHWAGPAASLVG